MYYDYTEDDLQTAKYRVQKRAARGRAIKHKAYIESKSSVYDLLADDFQPLLEDTDFFHMINTAYNAGFYMGTLYEKNRQKKRRQKRAISQDRR